MSKRFVHDDWSIPLPSGWNDTSILKIAGPPGGPMPSSVVIVAQPLSGDFRGTIEAEVGKLGQAIRGVSVAPLTPATHPLGEGLETTLDWDHPQGFRVRQKQVFLHVPPRLFAFTMSAAASAFASVEPALRAVVDGFTLD